MATNNKRRDASRRELESRLRERQAREARRRRMTLIGSVVGSVAVVALVVVLVIVFAGGNDKKKPQAASKKSPTPTPTSSAATASSSAAPVPTAACTSLSGKSKASFDGVTVSNFTDVGKQPTVTAKERATPKTLQCADLVVGKGAPATPASTVSVHYTGVLYQDGKLFDSSYKHSGAKPTSFSLAQVVPGFTQGIGGAGKVAPMRVGGTRVMILPSTLGYGAQASGAIPANSDLVFVVSLTKVS